MSDPSDLLLLVFDDPDGHLASLPDAVADFGWDADYVPDWPDAVADGGLADAVVVEASVPGGPRGALFGRLLEAFPRVPVIVASRTRSLSQALDFLRAGATDYQPVPAAPEEWRARVLDAVVRFRRLRAPVAASADAPPGDRLPAPGAGAEPLPDDAEVAVVAEYLEADAPPPAGGEYDVLAALARELHGRGLANHIRTLPENDAPPADAAPDAPPPEAGAAAPPSAGGDALAAARMEYDADGRFLGANAAAARLFGADGPDALRAHARTSFGAFSPLGEDGQPLYPGRWPMDAVRRDRGRHAACVSLRPGEGGRRWLHFACVPRFADGDGDAPGADHDGAPLVRVEVTLEDVTAERPPPAPF